jgi:hypothetical protein
MPGVLPVSRRHRSRATTVPSPPAHRHPNGDDKCRSPSWRSWSRPPRQLPFCGANTALSTYRRTRRQRRQHQRRRLRIRHPRLRLHHPLSPRLHRTRRRRSLHDDLCQRHPRCLPLIRQPRETPAEWSRGRRLPRHRPQPRRRQPALSVRRHPQWKNPSHRQRVRPIPNPSHHPLRRRNPPQPLHVRQRHCHLRQRRRLPKQTKRPSDA